jgi:hypothetical protein
MSTEAAPLTSFGDTYHRTPTAWKVAAAIGVLGWFLTLGGATTTTIDGVRTCDGFDAGPLVVAVIVAGLAVVGLRRARQGHVARQLPARAAWTGAALLGAFALAHVLRVVVEPAGAMC